MWGLEPQTQVLLLQRLYCFLNCSAGDATLGLAHGGQVLTAESYSALGTPLNDVCSSPLLPDPQCPLHSVCHAHRIPSSFSHSSRASNHLGKEPNSTQATNPLVPGPCFCSSPPTARPRDQEL